MTGRLVVRIGAQSRPIGTHFYGLMPWEVTIAEQQWLYQGFHSKEKSINRRGFKNHEQHFEGVKPASLNRLIA